MRLWNYFPTKKGEQLQKGRRKKRTRDYIDLPITVLVVYDPIILVTLIKTSTGIDVAP